MRHWWAAQTISFSRVISAPISTRMPQAWCARHVKLVFAFLQFLQLQEFQFGKVANTKIPFASECNNKNYNLTKHDEARGSLCVRAVHGTVAND